MFLAIARQTLCWYRTQHDVGSRYVCLCGLIRGTA
jgi:hypothetical protein